MRAQLASLYESRGVLRESAGRPEDASMDHQVAYAVRAGLLAAKHRLALFSDADLSTPIAETPKAVKYLDMPLQHASRNVLKLMKRQITREEMEDLIGTGVPVEVRAALPGASAHKLPFLSYGEGAYLGRLVGVIMREASPALALEPVYETDMAEGLKAMALEGHGLAFLPASSVKKELKNRRLVRAAPAGEHELTMEVRIYRERPEVARHPAKAGVQALWEFLAAR